MSQLPDTGFIRIRQILGNPKASPPTPPLIPIGKSTFWNWVKSGRFPRPVKIGNGRGTFWRVEDVRLWLAMAGGEHE